MAPLHIKIEGLIERAFERCCSKEVKKGFMMPKVSIFGDYDIAIKSETDLKSLSNLDVINEY